MNDNETAEVANIAIQKAEKNWGVDLSNAKDAVNIGNATMDEVIFEAVEQVN